MTALINEEFASIREEDRKNIGKSNGETTQKTTQKTDALILSLISDNPEITQEEMAQSTGLSIDGVKYQIKKLREAGIMKREGGRKSGRWTVLKPKE